MAKEKRRIIADESEISKKVKLKEEICAKAAERKRRSRKKQEETQSRECYHQLSPDSFLPQQEKTQLSKNLKLSWKKWICLCAKNVEELVWINYQGRIYVNIVQNIQMKTQSKTTYCQYGKNPIQFILKYRMSCYA